MMEMLNEDEFILQVEINNICEAFKRLKISEEDTISGLYVNNSWDLMETTSLQYENSYEYNVNTSDQYEYTHNSFVNTSFEYDDSSHMSTSNSFHEEIEILYDFIKQFWPMTVK